MVRKGIEYEKQGIENKSDVLQELLAGIKGTSCDQLEDYFTN